LFASEHGTRPQFQFDISSKLANADAWWNYWRALRAFSKNRGVVEITPKKIKDSMRFEIRRADAMQPYDFEAQLELCDTLSRVFRYAGLGAAPDFEWASIESQLSNVELIDKIMTGSCESFSSLVDESAVAHSLNGLRVIVANRFPIAERLVAYYALATTGIKDNGGRSEFTISDFVFRRAVLISQSEDDFVNFVNDAKRREGIEGFCSISPDRR
jgi:hypothetical protein